MNMATLPFGMAFSPSDRSLSCPRINSMAMKNLRLPPVKLRRRIYAQDQGAQLPPDKGSSAEEERNKDNYAKSALERAKAYKNKDQYVSKTKGAEEALQRAKAYKKQQSDDKDNTVVVEIITRDGIITRKVTRPDQAFSNVKDYRSSGISSMDFVGLGFSDKKKKQGLTGSSGSDAKSLPLGPLPEVQIITGDATKLGARTPPSNDNNNNSDDSALYKPKVATWGIFPRPENISKTYGGGKVIRPGEALETEEEKATREAQTKKLLDDYKEKMGLNVDPKLKVEYEKVEIPRLLIRQKDELEAAKAMFEAELEQRHRSLEDELVKRRQLAELRVARVDIKEAELLERHEQLEEKEEKVKEIEENLDAQLISLKESEQTLESGKCEIKIEKKKLEGLREILSNAKQDMESLREVIEEEKQQIQNEREKLTIIEEENNSFQNLKMKIKEEIDDFRASKKDVINEANQIKREKESLDGDYRILEEIKKQADKEREQANEEAESVLKWHRDEGERLKKEKCILTEQVEMNAEALHVETEAFIGNLEHERAEWFAKLEKEHNDLVQDFELQRNELARSTMERHKGIERWLQEKELEFQKKKQREVRCIYALKELAHMEVEESRLATERLEKGRQGINKLRKQTEMGWSAIKKGINELQIERQKLKQQRKLLQKEKEETLREFKQLQKLKNDLEVSEYSLMLSEQEASQESVNEGEFIHEESQGKPCGRTGSFLVSPCHLSLLHNHVSFANKSKSNIWFEKDAAADLMRDDIEHVIPFHDVGDDHVQNIKANLACPLSAVAEDTKLVLESYPYKECDPSSVTWEARRNTVGMVCDKENSCIVGENLVHNSMNSVIEGDGSQDSLVLQVNQQEADRKGNSGKKRSHRYSYTGTSEPNLFQSEIESEVSTGGPRKRLQ